MKDHDRMLLITALQNIRHGMLAAKHGAPSLPSLFAAEERLLEVLFDADEVDEYLASAACEVYGRERRTP